MRGSTIVSCVAVNALLLPVMLLGANPPATEPVQPAIVEPPMPASSKPAALPQPEKKKPLVLPIPIEATLAERIAKELIAASPVADPADIKARDAAAQNLAACADLMEAMHGRILWGGFNADQGYDPSAYRLDIRSRDDFFQLTEFHPLVWTKLYLSLFMFPGPYTVKQEGRFTVLEIDTKFRGDLDPGEYPYPFWHSVNKWTAYINVERLVLILEPGRLVAALRKSPPPLSLSLVKKSWDAKWNWTKENGEVQPRVALYTYLFSKDNPHVAALDQSYRELEVQFRQQNCITCHAPDNQSRINDLLLLNYPNQALIARRTLVAVLEDNRMPPGDNIAQEPTGIRDPEALQELIRLAKAFERQADAALAYDKSHPSQVKEPENKK